MTVNVMVSLASLGILISTVTSSEEPSKDGMIIIESLLICMELDFSKTVNKVSLISVISNWFFLKFLL